jgi:hypothetical protein
MVIWTGRGILIVLVFFATGIILAPIVPKDYWNYVFAFASFITAAFSWFMGDKWNNEEGRPVIDVKTGQKIILKRNHSLFFIKMQYWGIIFSIIGLIILLKTSIIVSAISAICFAIVCFLIYRNRRSLNTISNKPAMNSFVNDRIKKPIRIEPVINETVESEAERLKRRQEKEDPSRFMPK